MTKSKIAWTERVWNPVTGCTKVSPGCKNCYAEAIAHRYWGSRKFTDVRVHADRMDTPLHWRKPSRVFVNSMSDLFHIAVSDAFISAVFQAMAAAPQHTFQVLTKRPLRMEQLLTKWSAMGLAHAHGLPNVWLGVSVENQDEFHERVPSLMRTPASVRWLSIEPMLGPIVVEDFEQDYIDWIVVGGESGPNFRKMDPQWLESLIAHLKRKVPVFVKQDSGRFPGKQGSIPDRLWIKEYPRTEP